MVLLNINEVPVDFPFEPYDLQRDYMAKVIECLQKGQNGLLESPTGTGKTLCLLCASLAWLTTTKAQIQASQLCLQDNGSSSLRSQLENGTGLTFDNPATNFAMPKIIYASRTHSQLSQVLQELKRTNYGYIKASILGSRDQLCIHPEVSKEQNNAVKLHMCHARTAARSCFYHTNLEAKKEDRDFRENILDIEDLVALGKKHSACPYFMTREIRKQADIIFMPYNYLLDPKVRRMHNIELQGNIVIFDEAHNVEKMCEESASIQLRSIDIVLCIDEVTQIMKKFRDTDSEAVEAFGGTSSSAVPQDFTLDDLCVLKAMFLELEKALDGVVISKDEGITLPGEFMLELLGKADINPTKKDVILKLVDRVVQYLTVSSSSPFQRKGTGLQKFADLIKIVFSKDNFNSEHISRVKQSYKTHIQVEQNKGKAKSDSWSALTKSIKGGRVLSYWCFSPGFGMRDLVEQGVRSIVLTSGTLSPLSSFAAELQVPFPVTLENPHIIEGQQVLVGVINNGPDGTLLDSSFKNRENDKYVQALGRTIRSVAQVVPYGLLVFFPSYPVMKMCHEAWQASGVWDGLNQLKPIFVEPTSKEGFQSAMTGFYSAISESRRGACFMAVCRGKVSEGLDFADNNGRAVIITGLPYPPSRDPRVLEKQKYLDLNRKDPKFQGLTGQEWYRLEATRAVNQAIGRVIRHRRDYGAILLCDHRFGSKDLTNQLSSWVRPRVQRYDRIGPLLGELGKFFRNADVQYPLSEGHSKKPIKIAYAQDDQSASKSQTAVVSTTNHALKADPTRLFASYQSEKSQKVPENVPEPDLTAYASALPKPLPKETKRDLFTDQTDNNVIDFNETSSAGTEKGSGASTESQPQKRRKISLISEAEKLRRAKIAASQTRTSSALEYLKKIKEATNQESYVKFARLVRAYQNERNVENLIKGFKELIMDFPEHVELFKDFRSFVPKENLEQFEKIFLDL